MHQNIISKNSYACRNKMKRIYWWNEDYEEDIMLNKRRLIIKEN